MKVEASLRASSLCLLSAIRYFRQFVLDESKRSSLSELEIFYTTDAHSRVIVCSDFAQLCADCDSQNRF